MKRSVAGLCFLLVALFASESFAQKSRVVVDEFSVSRWVTDNMQALNIPSIAVGIVGTTDDYYLEAYGPAELNQPFLIGSLTKSVTAMAVMLLVQDKKLSLDDPASKWVSGVPDIVTVNHLLHQTSGLGRTDGGDMMSDLEQNVEQGVASASFDPPGGFTYSNLNYQILGRIVEKVSGGSYADFVREHIFVPAGFENTSADPKRPEGHVKGYQYMFGFPQDFGEPDYNPHSVSSGYVWMSPADMSRWLRLFLTGGKLDGKQVFPPEVIAKLLEKPADTDYAMGWLIDTGTPRHAKHTGATGAFSSAMAVVPEREFGIFVLTNVNSWMGLAPTNVLTGLMASMVGTQQQAVTNIEFIARLLFGMVVALIVFTFLFELIRWIAAKFPLGLSGRERKMFGLTVAINVIVVIAVTQYFETPIAVIVQTQPDLGVGFLLTVGLGTVRQLLTGFNKTVHQRVIMEGE